VVARPDGGQLAVTAVPAVPGPEDGERDAGGFGDQKFRPSSRAISRRWTSEVPSPISRILASR